MSWLSKLFGKREEPEISGPQYTKEVSFPVARFIRERDKPEERNALALQRAKEATDTARQVFYSISYDYRVKVAAVDFVEFDSDDAEVALAYFAIDYVGDNIDGQEAAHIDSEE